MATKNSDETAAPEVVEAQVVEAEVVEAQVVETPVVEAEPVVATPVQVAPAQTVAAETVPVEAVPVEAVPVSQVPAEQQPETAVLTETTPPAAPVQEVIVVDAPVEPRKKGNRGLGFALALLATVIFTALLVGAAFVLALTGDGDLGFLTEPAFYLPALAFFIGLLLVTLVLNRAGWWSHIIGSVVVGLITWFGSASLALVAAGMATMNQTEANEAFWAALFSPILIIAALLAREVAIWTGAILARRGRTLKVRNAEALEAYKREQADLTPTA